MDPWTLGLIVLLALGLGAILYGALHDRARNRRATAAMLAPPDRHIPQFSPETAAPQYLSELQARRAPTDAPSTDLTNVERANLMAAVRTRDAANVGVGYASKSFATDAGSGWAVVDDPAVVVCARPVTSIRELLPLMERALLSQRALVVVAPSLAAEVLATLEVNAIQQKLRLLAVTSRDENTLNRIAELTGATILQRGDLQAGYVPSEQLGRCARWVSDQRQSWLFTGPSTGSGNDATGSGDEPLGPSTGSGHEPTSSGHDSTGSGHDSTGSGHEG